MHEQEADVARMWLAIDALDFARMKAKLLHRRDGQWTPETVARAEAGYRQFLKLAAQYPDTAIVPNEEVDQFWHAHILDTRRYADDCERIFGFVLHHNPYVGIDGADDEARLFELASATGALMERTFGAGAQAQAAAYCAVTPGAQAQPAYCAIAPGAQAAQPAYCAVTPSQGQGGEVSRTRH